MEKKGKRWTKRDLRTIKRMTRDGVNNVEIAKVLGRTPGAICYQKNVMKVRMPKKGSVVKEVAEVEEMSPISLRGSAKDMARMARRIARANGRRITMALFFVEAI